MKKLFDGWLDLLEDGMKAIDKIGEISATVFLGILAVLLLLVLTPLLFPFALITKAQRILNGK